MHKNLKKLSEKLVAKFPATLSAELFRKLLVQPGTQQFTGFGMFSWTQHE